MNVIVTGASRGIGYHTVKMLAQNPGFRIVAIARTKEKLQQLKSECEASGKGVKIFPIVFDLASNKLNDDILILIKQAISGIDILINNAGHLVNKPFIHTTQDDLQSTFNVNFFSVYRLIQLLIPHFNKSKGAHIVNISSMGGFQGSTKFPGLSAYSASKGALSVLTESLAVELGEYNIKVNALAIGATATEMLLTAFPGYKASVSAEQMGKFIADFSIKASTHFNGKVIPVSL